MKSFNSFDMVPVALFLSRIFGLEILIAKSNFIKFEKSPSSAKRSTASKNEFKRVIPGPSSDESGKYNIHRFYKSEGFGTKMINKDVTLVTHCTVDQMYHLMEMSDRWDGPMSGKVPYFGRRV